jgi:hypothetical protein
MTKKLAFLFPAIFAIFATGWSVASREISSPVATAPQAPAAWVGCKSATLKKNTYAAFGIDALGESEVARREGRSQWIVEMMVQRKVVRLAAGEQVCVTRADGDTALLLLNQRVVIVRRNDLVLNK